MIHSVYGGVLSIYLRVIHELKNNVKTIEVRRRKCYNLQIRGNDDKEENKLTMKICIKNYNLSVDRSLLIFPKVARDDFL